MRFSYLIFLAILLVRCGEASAAPITYYDLDFEDGTSGGGYTFSGFGTATNINSSHLDGRSLYFEVDDQMVWDRNNLDSDYHYVSFDYYAEQAANVTHFLDVPSILRSDVDVTGRHNVELYYDFNEESVLAFLDGEQYDDLVSITAWPFDKQSQHIRILNQSYAPGNSAGNFEIDNLVWQGEVQYNEVPEPGVWILLLSGLLGLWMSRNHLPHLTAASS